MKKRLAVIEEIAEESIPCDKLGRLIMLGAQWMLSRDTAPAVFYPTQVGNISAVAILGQRPAIADTCMLKMPLHIGASSPGLDMLPTRYSSDAPSNRSPFRFSSVIFLLKEYFSAR